MFHVNGAETDAQIDVEGIRRGRCVMRDCSCHEFYRRVQSVNCNCGHSGMQHVASLVSCRGTLLGGGSCPCQVLLPPPAGYTECRGCGHHTSLHGPPLLSLNSVGNGSGGANLAAAHSGIRDMANRARQSDYDKAITAEEARGRRGGHGGRRVGAGRKALIHQDVDKKINVTPGKQENGKPTLTRVDFTRTVKVRQAIFNIPLLKAACRREFGDALGLDLSSFTKRTTGMVDKIYLHACGPVIPDDAEGRDLSFPSCWYYNSEFDAIPNYAAKKRKSKIPVFEGDEYIDSNDEEEEKGNVKRPKGEGNEEEPPNSPLFDSNLCGHDEISASDKSPLFIANDSNLGGQEEVTTSDNASATAHAVASRFLSSEFEISVDMANIVMDFCQQDADDASNLLVKLICGGDGRDEAAKELHRFFAFKELRGVETDDKELYVRLVADKNGPPLRDQLIKLHKKATEEKSTVNFRMKADVKFGEGMGTGPCNSYMQAIREEILRPLFEGTDDHKIITASSDQLLKGAYLRAGEFMGQLVRNGGYVMAGLAQTMKLVLRGDIERKKLDPAMEDLPSFDLQQILKKVKNCEELTESERSDFTQVVSDCGIVEGVKWTPQGFCEVEAADRYNVIESIAHFIVLCKRNMHIKDLSDGFNGICKFDAFVKLCTGTGGREIANVLTRAYFPMHNETSVTKNQLLAIIRVHGEVTEERTQFVELLKKIIGRLDEKPTSAKSVSKFMELCTGSPHADLETSITFIIGDHKHSDFKVNVCSKTVDISRCWLQSKDLEKAFVEIVLEAVETGYQDYNKD